MSASNPSTQRNRMAKNKYFLVTGKDKKERLVEAKNRGEALSYVIGSDYSCDVAKTEEVIQFLSCGGALEVANPQGSPQTTDTNVKSSAALDCSPMQEPTPTLSETVI